MTRRELGLLAGSVDGEEEGFGELGRFSFAEVACAVAVANIRLIQQLKLVEHVRDDVGPYLAEHFRALGSHPLVGDAETCGLMGAILLVKDNAGKVLEQAEPQAIPVISKETAYLVTNMMEDVIQKGTGQAAKVIGRPIAGKTGTTNDFINAWFIGGTPRQ